VAFIETVPVDEATGEVRRMYEDTQTHLGYVPNYAKVFSHRPGVLDGWAALQKSIKSQMDLRRFELVTLAAARALRSSYCCLAHGTVLQKRFFSPVELRDIARSKSSALDDVDRAIMAFAEKVARDADAINRDDVQTLRDHGLTDPEIFDVAAAAAARCFFSKTLDAMGAEPDASYQTLGDELCQALTVGRAISADPLQTLSTPAPAPDSDSDAPGTRRPGDQVTR
jgi:uncharacterized peroxidase-related enzyme